MRYPLRFGSIEGKPLEDIVNVYYFSKFNSYEFLMKLPPADGYEIRGKAQLFRNIIPEARRRFMDVKERLDASNDENLSEREKKAKYYMKYLCRTEVRTTPPWEL